MSIILPNLNHPFICPLPIPVPVPVPIAGSTFRILCFSIRLLTAPPKANKFWEPKHVNFLSHGSAVARNYEPFSYFTCLHTTTFIFLRIAQSSTF